jgi:putative ABC transport system permease protein
VVALGIGLVGIAAGLSAQVLSRRKEFGLLAHLGLRRRDVMRMVLAEVMAWLAAGVVVGTLLGLAIGAVLVYVVNPQSFNWSMEMHVPWLSVAMLAVGVMAAGALTTWITARQAMSMSAVQAVRDDA